jgi:hypothetical protein
MPVDGGVRTDCPCRCRDEMLKFYRVRPRLERPIDQHLARIHCRNKIRAFRTRKREAKTKKGRGEGILSTSVIMHRVTEQEHLSR